MNQVSGLRGALLAAALASASLAFAAPAEALTFDFSFTNTTGNFPGTISGQIFGLTDNSTSAATQVIVEGVPVNYSADFPTPTYPLDTTADATSISSNAFTVVAGVITNANYFANNSTDPNQFQLELLTNSVTFAFDVEENGSSLVATGAALFTPEVSTTPLPGALPLFVSGLGALGLLVKRRKRKNAATVAIA